MKIAASGESLGLALPSTSNSSINYFPSVSVKNKTATWLIEMLDYVQDNPPLLVNGFLKAGISQAIDDSIANTHAE